VFTPGDATMYPGRDEGAYSVYVVEESISRRMEGASRPTHFRGVTTIVAKLFNIVLPDVAVFGAKDWQQAQVIRRMTANLNFPVRIIVSETVREPDGLAMSSRNTYLTPDQRKRAPALRRALLEARERVRKKGEATAAELRRLVETRLNAEPEFRVDYVEFFHPETLAPVDKVKPGARAALAVYVGRTRLIDNAGM
jgi:pantoate--beta-alanine ligase